MPNNMKWLWLHYFVPFCMAHALACYCTLLHAIAHFCMLFLHVFHDSAYVWSLQEKTSPPVPWIPPSWASGLKLNLGVNSFLTNIYHLEPFSKLGLKGIKMISLMSSIISTPIIVGLNRSGSRVTSIYSCRAFGLERYRCLKTDIIDWIQDQAYNRDMLCISIALKV